MLESRFAVNASALERWMLKVLCGIISSGNAMFRNEPIPKSNPPLAWLQILFAKMEMPVNWGLYWRNGPGDRIMSRQSFLFAPLVDGRQLVGCRVEILGSSFLLAMRDPGAERKNTLLDGAIYRPRGIILTSHQGHRNAEVLLDWDGRDFGDFIRIQHHPVTGGE
jgi:hypothetical protein